MPKDINLRLVDDDTFTITAQTTAINTEGGYRADVRMKLGDVAGAGDTMDVVIEASINGGSNYYSIGAFPTIGPSQDDKEIARSCYIPRPASGQDYTKVRLNITIAGNGGESFQIEWAYVEPLLSLAPPALDEKLTQGLALLDVAS